MAWWLAILTGLVVGGFWTAQRVVFGRLTCMHPGLLWICPVAQLVLFSALGGVVALVVRRVKHPDALRISAMALLALSFVELVWLVPGLHPVARILLILGASVYLGDLACRYLPRLLWLVRRTLPPLAVALVLIALFQDGPFASRGDSQPAAAAENVTEDAPNLLLIVLDTLRADALGWHGTASGDTPFLDRLAENGTVFHRAYGTAPWTLPSTAGMFTGRYPWELSADWEQPLDGRFPSIAQRLRRAGYQTAGFVGNTRYCSSETGLARGFGHYEDYRLTWDEFAQRTALGSLFFGSRLASALGFYDTPARKSAEEVNAGFLRWLDRDRHGRFFAFLNYFDVHHPYVAPEPYQEHPPRSIDERYRFYHWWWVSKRGASEAEPEYYREAYRDCARYLDAQLERLFAELRRRGALENTVVIITADHGEHFGDHGLYLHGNSLYEALIHVPLCILLPGEAPQAGRVEEPVSLRDLPATLLDFAGLENDAFPGASLRRFWRGGAGGDAATPVLSATTTAGSVPPCHGRSPVAAGPMRCIISQRYKYIRRGDGREELYDLQADAGESTSLVGDPAREDLIQRLRSGLRVESDAEADPAAP